MVKDLPQNDPPLGGGGSNSSSLCRNVEETSDYDLKPLHLSYLVIRSNLEEHLYDVWNQTFYFVISPTDNLGSEKKLYTYIYLVS